MISRDEAESRVSALGRRTGTEFEPAKNISGSELTPEKLIQSPQP